MKREFNWLTATLLLASALSAEGPMTSTVKGYVIDSACAYTRSLDKPISAKCAKDCARNGSPLVLLGEDGAIYWPIDSARPAHGQNQKLMPFAGEKVVATGKIYDRGGSKAIVLESVKKQ